MAKFEYVSALRVNRYDGYTTWAVDVKNTGDAAGECTVTPFFRMYDSAYGWSAWGGMYSTVGTATLAPGAVVTFYGWMEHSARLAGPQVMVKSPAGTLLDPTEPKEFICGYCWSLYKKVVSFATIEELNAHIASEHPQYAPMDPLRNFSVKGVTWPDHFTKYGEDYGRIISWYALAFTSMLIEGEMWDGYVNPDGGAIYRSVDLVCNFTMPEGWVGAYRDQGGLIPNTTKIRLYFQTDLGWLGWLDDSPYIDRIPDRSTITFGVSSTGAENWQIVPPELQPQFAEFSIVGYERL